MFFERGKRAAQTVGLGLLALQVEAMQFDGAVNPGLVAGTVRNIFII